MNLTEQDVKNLLTLISMTPIKGNEATTVAVLQQKLTAMLPAPTLAAKPEENDTTTPTTK